MLKLHARIYYCMLFKYNMKYAKEEFYFIWNEIHTQILQFKSINNKVVCLDNV